MRQAIPIAKTSLCLAQIHRLRTVHLLNEAYEPVLELHKTRPDVIVVNVETRIVEGASFDGSVWVVNIMTGIVSLFSSIMAICVLIGSSAHKLWSESASLVSLGPSATSVSNQLDPLSKSLPHVAGSTHYVVYDAEHSTMRPKINCFPRWLTGFSSGLRHNAERGRPLDAYKNPSDGGVLILHSSLSNSHLPRTLDEAPQSSKARQWVEVRDWWSHSVLLTHACAYNPGGKAHPPASGCLTFALAGDDSAVRQLSALYSIIYQEHIFR
ncbi:hypothetical protein Agabi119p4_9270 [Agaricus bisporus var. burnettii]|uniref:Uncharacterized protein n=1 Tax=Agaricus bisporus var. burnettii TaxID=192524 RepID=A0A8H7C514_AGABI|nr:hypothetical protein Agabi119p4_9270 [Agaricus bisporus var. burnettii]